MVYWQREMTRRRACLDMGFEWWEKIDFLENLQPCACHSVGLWFECAPPTWLRTPQVEKLKVFQMRSSHLGHLVGTNANPLQTRKSPLGLRRFSQKKKTRINVSGSKGPRMSSSLACEPPFPCHVPRCPTPPSLQSALGVWEIIIPYSFLRKPTYCCFIGGKI